MSSLKTFILREATRTSYAELYLSYLEKYHPEVFVELQKLLEHSWKRAVAELVKRYPLSATAAQEAQLRNPGASLEIQLVATPQKLYNPGPGDPKLVSPSVNLPLAFPLEARHIFIRTLLDSTEDTFKTLVKTWSEVFHHEHRNGQLAPSFKIVRDRNEIKLQLVAGDDHYKTLYAVRTEAGKATSKLRDFDRVYLTSLV